VCSIFGKAQAKNKKKKKSFSAFRLVYTYAGGERAYIFMKESLERELTVAPPVAF
jgi:hypothetical protein